VRRIRKGQSTYVPGFWSWKGLSSTVFTLMMVVYVLQAGLIAIEAIVDDQIVG
jgi:hypothetical protein